MNNSVKLSIIVPVYNAGKFLDKCLTSIIEQTITDIEILLINDGSTDNSLEICEVYANKDSRIKIFSQQNSGQSKARNVGLDNASGKYITFVDSDDWVDSDYYEKLVNAAEFHSADIACASIIRERKNTNKYRIFYDKEGEYSNSQEKMDITKCPDKCYVWNKVYNAELIKKINLRFVENMIFEDVDFVCKAVYFSNKVVTVPETYYHYRVNSNSTVKTMRKSDKMRSDALQAKQYMLDFYKKYNLKTTDSNRIKEKHCIKVCGLTILKVYIWETKKKYYLFGFIPVVEEIIYA